MFDIGDTVYMFDKNAVNKIKIDNISICTNPILTIHYEYRCDEGKRKFQYEKDVFKSKKKLLKSL